MAGRAPDQGPEARQHLGHVEGLGHIVVGAGIESGNLLAPAIARGQDQDRHPPPGRPPALEHADAVDHGQPEIEHDRIIGLVRPEIVALLAIGREIDRIARLGQTLLELPGEIPIILDHQHPHRHPRSPTLWRPPHAWHLAREPSTAKLNRF